MTESTRFFGPNNDNYHNSSSLQLQNSNLHFANSANGCANSEEFSAPIFNQPHTGIVQ